MKGQPKKRAQDQGRSRRDFLKATALGMGAITVPSLPVFAGPFNLGVGGHLVPADKKLEDSWIRSLYDRGKPEVLEGGDLRYVGMPIGGIACGQLYLGGDGRLWLWHIFRIQYRRNPDSQLLTTMEQGGHYANPDGVFERESRPVDQGVAIRVRHRGKDTAKKISSEGFKDIRFRGEYPVCKINYREDELPVDVELEAFSPFIPGELTKSAYPCTILSYTVRNRTSQPVEVSLGAWLENAVNPYETDPRRGWRTTRLVATQDRSTLLFASESRGDPNVPRLEDLHGYGSMSLSLYRPSRQSKFALNIDEVSTAGNLFQSFEKADGVGSKVSPLDQKSVSALSESFELEPGDKGGATFIVGWYFPHLNQQEDGYVNRDMYRVEGIENLKLHYADRFKSADEVAYSVCDNFEELTSATRLWNKTWYDSSLPYWLLDRSFISLNCAASNTLVWFNNNRLWGWEGVECCPGTCTHVWQYAQALAFVFPEAERNFREVTDLSKLGLNPNASLRHRAETGVDVAHDGHCGTIMRLYREHRNSPDRTFLSRNYSKIENMIRFIISEDGNRDGLLEGKQTNTLDAAWYGPMGWISSLYLGALLAGKLMAIEMGDQALADECDELLVKGRKNLVDQLYNGEYFIHQPDENHPEAINSNEGCHIDQVLGQSFAHTYGIDERVLPKEETVSALASIWKYNFSPDAFDYQLRHKAIKGSRTFATQGEAATLMCTWPRGGAEKAVPGMDERPENPKVWSGPGIYFDETMNGFEYQVASHMIWEGLVEKGLATARAVHDRYTARKRNPFNEIECSDHYSRSMASYGVFLAVCGFQYHGPKGFIAFDPRVTPQAFRAPFTTAEGWGSFSQTRTEDNQENQLVVKYGRLRLRSISLGVIAPRVTVRMLINEEVILPENTVLNGMCTLEFGETVLRTGDKIQVKMSW